MSQLIRTAEGPKVTHNGIAASPAAAVNFGRFMSVSDDAARDRSTITVNIPGFIDNEYSRLAALSVNRGAFKTAFNGENYLPGTPLGGARAFVYNGRLGFIDTRGKQTALIGSTITTLTAGPGDTTDIYTGTYDNIWGQFAWGAFDWGHAGNQSGNDFLLERGTLTANHSYLLKTIGTEAKTRVTFWLLDDGPNTAFICDRIDTTILFIKPPGASCIAEFIYDLASTSWSLQSWKYVPNLAGAAPIDINFKDYFTGVLQSVQTDLGLVYGTTALASGTTPPAVTLIGTPTQGIVPIRIQCSTPGIVGTAARFQVSFDGGSTFAMTGINPTPSSLYPLTGLGTGVSIIFASGSGATDNSWTATCAQLTDQSGNGCHAVQPTTSAQPIVDVGLSGHASIKFDGVDDFLIYNYASALPAPSTKPTFFWAVWRYLDVVANTRCFLGDALSTGFLVYLPISSTSPRQYNGSDANVNSAGSVGTWVRAEAFFSNSTSDYLKWGSNKVQVGNAGNSGSNRNRKIGDANGANHLTLELLAFLTMDNLPTPTQLAAASAAVTAKYGPGLV